MRTEALHIGTNYQRLGMRNITLEEWQALYSILERSWFRRVWVFQEYACARRTTVLGGPEKLSFATLHHVSIMLYETNWCVGLLRAAYNFDPVLAQKTVSMPKAGVGPVVLDCFRWVFQEKSTFTVMQILSDGRSHGATAPRTREIESIRFYR